MHSPRAPFTADMDTLRVDPEGLSALAASWLRAAEWSDPAALAAVCAVAAAALGGLASAAAVAELGRHWSAVLAGLEQRWRAMAAVSAAAGFDYVRVETVLARPPA